MGVARFRSWFVFCWWPSQIYIRLQLQETPIFQEIKAKGR